MNLVVNNNKEKEKTNTPPHEEKNHWEKYGIYYLVFGSFFLSLLFIFVVNYSTNKEIGKVSKQVERFEESTSQAIEAFERIFGSIGRKPNKNDGEEGGGNNQHNHDHGGQPSEFYEPDPTRKNENWVNDVIVQKDVNKKVKKWINCFKLLPLYLIQSQELDKHVLFCGPPGCGKSFIAEEFCHNETSGFVFANFETQIWAGSSIEKQQRVFTKAKELLKKNAARGEKKPIAIVIEEIDSVGTKGNISAQWKESAEVNGILKMFDEINRKDLNIIVIATTNNPEVLNEALVRPGRLGRRITVDYPTEEETRKLINYLRKIMEKNWRKVVGIDESENRIVEWSDDYWENVYQSAREIGTEFRKQKEGFSFRDLQKAVGSCLEIAVAEDNPKIIPDVQDFEEDLRETLQTRVDDLKNKPKFKIPFYPIPKEPEIPKNES